MRWLAGAGVILPSPAPAALKDLFPKDRYAALPTHHGAVG
jgi:hypothetical protein